MKKGTQLELTLEKFADRGKSLARIDGMVVFVPGGVPGDTVKATIVRKKKRHAEARIDELITPSPKRTEPRCSYFGTCGGCKWQHVKYENQLAAKKQSVSEAFEHHAGIADMLVHDTVGSAEPYFYRNKMEFSFSQERWLTSEEIASGVRFDLSFSLGLHAPGYFNKVIDLTECYLQSTLSARLVNGFRGFAKARGWKAWHIRKHEGYLRHLVVRQAGKTDDLMINLVTSRWDEERASEVAEFLKVEFPEVTTFVNGVHKGVAQTAFGESLHTIYGPGTIKDRIGAYTFEIGPNAFFQTNTGQAERLYEIAREYGRLTPDDLVYDLYCGAGTISIFVSPHVKRVLGVELIEQAVENARANAKANGIENVSFESGDMLKLFTPDFVRSNGKPDVVIVDPPRAGIHPKVVKRIGELKAPRLVYVSCNPMTQARDLALLSETYSIDQLQPVDLFPHTYHVENVAQLTLKEQ